MNQIKTLLSALYLSATTIVPVAAQEVVTIDRSTGSSVEFDETEGMTIRYDSLLNDWKVKMYLYMDSTCNGTDIDPTFPDSVYIDRLQRIPAVMEMPYNHIVRQYIDRYTKRLRKSVSVMLGAGNFYFPIFEAELERYGLPLELKYLPVIESALKPKAVSPAGAGGLWQFMVGTGKQYGLKVNSVIDERCDPIRSSDAAARYLRDLYRIYHDWALVLAAYNCGPGNVNRAIHRAGARDYWQIYPYLPKETRGYVPAFIAATYAMTYYCEHGICPMRSRFPIATDTIMIHRDISMRQISEVVGIDINVLKSLNPQYRTDRIPGKSQPCSLRMPDDMLHAFLDYGDDVYKYRANELLARRAEVSVRGERNSRATASTTQQPSAPTQNTMPPSEMPNIANTEAIVPTEEQTPTRVQTVNTQQAQRQRTDYTGEVIEVAVTDSPETTKDNNEQGSTTITFDDDEGSLQPVQINTQRTPTTSQRTSTAQQTSTQTSATSSSSNNNTSTYRNRSQHRQRHYTNRQQTTTTQQQAHTQSNRSQQQTTQRAQTQTQTQTGSRSNRNQQAQNSGRSQQQQQAASQTSRNRSQRSQATTQNTQQQTQSTSSRNRSQQTQTRQSTGSRNRTQQAQSSGRNQQQQQAASQTSRNRSQRSQATTQNTQQQGKQQTQSTSSRNRSQQTQTQQSRGSRNRTQQAQSSGRSSNNSSQTQSQSGKRQAQATPANRPRTSGSGKAGSSRK